MLILNSLGESSIIHLEAELEFDVEKLISNQERLLAPAIGRQPYSL